MKIGVIGFQTISDIIRKTIEKKQPDLEVVYKISENYRDSARFVEELEQAEVQGILFADQTHYIYASKHHEQKVPWTFLPYSSASLIRSVLEAIVTYHIPPETISIDSYREELVRDALEEVGIHDCTILTPPSYSIYQPEFESGLRNFHRWAYRRKRASICLTTMEAVRGPLAAEGIPCVCLLPVEDLILKQIYQLQIQNLTAKENKGSIATIAIYFDYSYTDGDDAILREYEKIRYQNKMRELIFSIAQHMNAAVFCESIYLYYIVTTRRILMESFLDKGEHQNLLRQAQQSPHHRIWTGIGIGDTSLESKSRATRAINYSLQRNSGSSYLAEDEHQFQGPLSYETKVEQQAAYFMQKLHMSDLTFSRLKKVLAEHGDQITSQELAAYMEITERSANRLILHLEQENCVTTIGKHSKGKGRPARILKITLPC